MKFILAQWLFFLDNKTQRKNFTSLVKFFCFLCVAMALYSVLFHFIMIYEGRQFSWLTGLYWTLTVMSTLGFGDITFTTDLGKAFTILVLMSGIILLLVMLPFTFIQLFYAPWLEAQEKNRMPKELPANTSGHVIFTNLEPIVEKLITKLNQKNIPYVVIMGELAQAAQLFNAGYKVVVGEVDDPETYRRVRVQQAAMVVATNSDLLNTSIAFTVRGLTSSVPIVASMDNENSLDILNFPGNTKVFNYTQMLGQSLAARTIGLGKAVNVISQFKELLIAEIAASQTGLIGKTLRDLGMRQKTGATVVGFWEKGQLLLPRPDTVISERALLLLAGTQKQLEMFETCYALPEANKVSETPVVILGGGRVGMAVSRTLKEHGIKARIVEKRAVPYQDETFVLGDAADINVLEKAGVMKGRTVIITTHNDSMNVYLAFYCRQLRPDIQIIVRANNQRSVSKLHMAGADLVLSYATMGANTIFSCLRPDEISMLNEGLTVFIQSVPASLLGKTLIESKIRESTGCSVIALKNAAGVKVNPEPSVVFEKEDKIILIGVTGSEQKFLDSFG